jgi:methionyl-tRNA formyltransferase
MTQSHRPLKCLFMGTPDFAVPALEILANHPSIELSLVISMPSRPKGRGQEINDPPVITFCKEQKISFMQSENINKDEKLIQECKNIAPDFIIVLAFAQFLNDQWLNLAKNGCFNIHTSLLPRWRGAAPITYALLHGDQVTGVSIQKMVKKMDAGDICQKMDITIREHETGGSLYARLKFAAALTLEQFILNLVNNSLSYEQQDEKEITFAKTLTREEGECHFALKSALEIERRARALYPWPGTYFFIKGKRVKIHHLIIPKALDSIDPGKILIKNDAIYIGCEKGAVQLLFLQSEGKKKMNAQQFIHFMQWKEREEISL